MKQNERHNGKKKTRKRRKGVKLVDVVVKREREREGEGEGRDLMGHLVIENNVFLIRCMGQHFFVLLVSLMWMDVGSTVVIDRATCVMSMVFMLILLACFGRFPLVRDVRLVRRE
jgi:hypothetical protein